MESFHYNNYILLASWGLQKARGPRPGPIQLAKARPDPGPSPFLDGPGHGPQFRPDLARLAGPPLKKYIYIYI